MELRQVQLFLAAAEEGSITAAARRMHLTQPALSRQIKALEEELGVALFDRRPGRISLTRAGEALLVDAEQVLTAAGHLLGRARELQGEVTGALLLGTVADPDSLRLGSLLSGLVRALPLLEIKTRGGLAEELRDQVAAGLMHGAFYIGPHIPREATGLALQTLHYRIAGPFSMRQQILHAGWRDIAAMPWIGAPVQHHAQTLLKDMFARQGLVPHQVVECDETAAPLALVRSGVGLALLREDVAVPAGERDEVVVWPHARVGALLSFIHPRSAEHDPAIVATLSVLRTTWGLG